MKLGGDRNPKFVRLMELLGVSRPMTVGLLELLWHATAEFAPQGDIGRFDDRGIAKLIGWRGNPERLVGALVEARWLDPDPVHRLLVHDWPDHAPAYVRKRLERADMPYFHPAADNGRQDPPSCLPTLTMPYLNQALPSRTQPNQDERENSGLAPAERILALAFPNGGSKRQRQTLLDNLDQARREGVPWPFLAWAIVSNKSLGPFYKRIDSARTTAKRYVTAVNERTWRSEASKGKQYADLEHVLADIQAGVLEEVVWKPVLPMEQLTKWPEDARKEKDDAADPNS